MIDFETWLSRLGQALLIAVLLMPGASLLGAQSPDSMSPPPGGPPPGEFQPEQPHAPSVQRELKRLTRLLALTDDQQAQVKTILTAQQQQIKDLLQKAQSGTSGDGSTAQQSSASNQIEALRAQVKSIRAAANDKIAALLTGDQSTKFAAWEKRQEKRAEAEQQNQDEMPPPPPPGDQGPPPDGGGGPPGI